MVQRCVSVAPEPDRELPVQYLNTELGAENAALLQSALAPNPGMWLLSLRGLTTRSEEELFRDKKVFLQSPFN